MFALAKDICEGQQEELLNLLKSKKDGVTFDQIYRTITTFQDSISVHRAISVLTKARACKRENNRYYWTGTEPVFQDSQKKQEEKKLSSVDEEIKQLMKKVVKTEESEEEDPPETESRTPSVFQMLTKRTVVEPLNPTFVNRIAERGPVNPQPLLPYERQSVDVVSKTKIEKAEKILSQMLPANKKPPELTVVAKPEVKTKNGKRGEFRRTAGAGKIAFMFYSLRDEGPVSYSDLHYFRELIGVSAPALHQAIFGMKDRYLDIFNGANKLDNRFSWKKEFDYPFQERFDSDMVLLGKELRQLRDFRTMGSPAPKRARKQSVMVEDEKVVVQEVEETITQTENTVNEAPKQDIDLEELKIIKTLIQKEIDYHRNEILILEKRLNEIG